MGESTRTTSRRRPDAASSPAPGRLVPHRVALAGDWHGNTRWAQHVIDEAAAQGCDVLVHLGDFGLWPGRGGREYIDALSEHLEMRGVTLFWIDGNHDDHGALATAPLVDGVHLIAPRIIHLPRGFRWSWHGRTWLAIGGAVSIDRNSRIPTRSWWPEEVISDADVATCIAGGPADVIVAHDCPAGVAAVEAVVGDPVWNLPPDIEADSSANRRRMREIVDAVHPSVVYHGHYHLAYRERFALSDGAPVEATGLDCDGTSLEGNLLLLPPPDRSLDDIGGTSP